MLLRTLALTCAATLFATTAFAQTPARSACNVNVVGALDVTWQGSNRPLVHITAAGQHPYALVDTGSSLSALFAPAVPILGLRIESDTDVTARGLGGRETRLGVVEVPSFAIIGDQTRTSRMGIIPDVVGRRLDVVMVIGQDVLTLADDEFDFAHDKIRFLNSSGDCRDAVLAYWDGDVSEVPLRHNDSKSILVTVQLNGHDVRALLDTGAPTSVVSETVARAAGAAEEADGKGDAVRGVGGAVLTTWLGRFDTFQIGGETIGHARLRVANWRPGHGGQSFDMILGADFFRSHRVLAAYSQHKLYFTYLGGPVFQVVGPLQLPPDADSDAPAPASTEPQSMPSASNTPH